MEEIKDIKWDNSHAVHVCDEEEFSELRQIYRDYFAGSGGGCETVNFENWETYPYIYLDEGFHGCSGPSYRDYVEFPNWEGLVLSNKVQPKMDCEDLVSLI